MMVKFWKKGLSNISSQARIGDGTVVHSHISIHDDVVIGENCQIEGHCFLPSGVRIGDRVFIGPGCVFTNDSYMDMNREDFLPVTTRVESDVKIGAGCIIRAGVTIGEGAMLGMGSVVTKNIPAGELWFGNPARFVRKIQA